MSLKSCIFFKYKPSKDLVIMYRLKSNLIFLNTQISNSKNIKYPGEKLLQLWMKSLKILNVILNKRLIFN